jgi:putative membrane protein
MEGKKIIKENYAIFFMYLIFFVGILGHSFNYVKPLMLTLTPFTLFLMGMLVVILIRIDWGNNFYYWGSLTFFITLFLEIIGVKTGIIFGSYYYGSTLGFKVLDVPLIIGFNWVLVISGAYSISLRIAGNKWLKMFSTSALAVLFDILLEPNAIALDYWQWKGGKIPVQNYAAWFLVAFVASFIALKFGINKPSKPAIHYFIVQSIFFFSFLIFN